METIDILASVIRNLQQELEIERQNNLLEAEGFVKLTERVSELESQVETAKEKVRRLSLGQKHIVCLTCPESQWANLQELTNENTQLKRVLDMAMDKLKALSGLLAESDNLKSTNEKLKREVDGLVSGLTAENEKLQQRNEWLAAQLHERIGPAINKRANEIEYEQAGRARR